MKASKVRARTLIFLDGLDDLQTVKAQGAPLFFAGLLEAVARINEALREGRAPVKIVLACRTDVYGRIDAPRAGKIRRDFSTELDWYQNPRDVGESNLVKLVNLRARLADPSLRGSDLARQFFPPKLLGRSAWEAVLEQTRHTPRDVLQLLKIMQKQVTSPGSVTEAQILGGFADYSDGYFMDEAHDALRFYFNDSEREKILDVLGRVRQRNFSFKSLRDMVDEDSRLRGLDIEDAVRVLYDNGFLGNLTPGGPSGFASDYYRFKYRNPRASLRWDEPLAVHFGLWKALNVA